MRYQVAVCGPAECTDLEREQAYQIGALLADRGAVLLCGGGTGVMAGAAAGARSRGGLVVAIRPDSGRTPGAVNIATDLGQARNAVLVNSADAVIAVGGSWGTLSEVALAMRRGGVPVVTLGGWRVLGVDGTTVPGIILADTPEAAVESVFTARD